MFYSLLNWANTYTLYRLDKHIGLSLNVSKNSLFLHQIPIHIMPFFNSSNAEKPLRVRPFHLFLFGALIVSTIICNTQRGEKQQKERVDWSFLGDDVLIYADKYSFSDGSKPIYKNIEVVVEGANLYKNKTSDFVSNFGVLPIVRKTSTNQIEFLLGFKDTRNEKILRLISETKQGSNQIVLQDTLPLFGVGHQDLDEDGIIEFSGFLEHYPPHCVDCDSVYYNPLLFYEMQDHAFVLDTPTTRNWINENYQEFRGFKPDPRLVRLKK